MNTVSKALLLAATGFLGACSHYNEDLSALDQSMKAPASYVSAAAPQDVAPAAGAVAPSADLGPYLARDYYDLAKYENDKAYDYKAAKLYTGKAMAASKGQITAPSRVAAYDVPENKIPELNEARETLISALRTGNTQGNEAVLAKAQTNFDCWLERAEEASDETHYASCKEGFEQAMAQLVMPAAGVTSTGTQMMEVSFAPKVATIDATSVSAVEQVASFLNAPEGAGYTAVITGFTAMATPSEADRQLASNRVLKVREILLGKGVADASIKPQIAPVPQLATVVPVAGAPAADQGGLDHIVQIHLVAPVAAVATPVSVSVPVVTQTTTTTYSN